MSEWVENPVILCVDDEASVLQAVRSQLREHYKNTIDIEIASSGSEAIEMVNELMEDGVDLWVVLCDEIMPEQRGHQVLAEIHKASPDTRTVLLTGQTELEAVTESVNHANLFHFIAKPWERMDLLMTVDRAIESLQADRERRRRTEVFHRFVPSDFLAVLGVDDPINAQVNIGMMQNMSVLFTDIRGFTSLSESQSPETVFASLNSVFDIIVPVISSHNGVVDKFIGDAVMALFQSPKDATLAGIEIVQKVEQIQTPMGALRVGVGINSGDLILGTVGNFNRIQTTVIGDVVNVASRIEALTKVTKTSLLLSDATANQIDLPTRFLGRFEVKGRQEALGIHQCLTGSSGSEMDAIAAGSKLFSEMTSRPGLILQAENTEALKTYTQQFPDDTVAIALYAMSKELL
jgi:two-component system sensor histidine kinase ChiS